MAFFDTPSFSRPFKQAPPMHPALSFGSTDEKSLLSKSIRFNPDATDGDGDGKEQDGTAFERPTDDLVKLVADPIKATQDRFKKKYGKELPRGGDGDCYSSAVDTARTLAKTLPPEDVEGIRIVHGIVTGTGGDVTGVQYDHAWVEVDRSMKEAEQLIEKIQGVSNESIIQMQSLIDGLRSTGHFNTVYDYSNGREIELPASMYYGIGNIDPSDNQKYTINEAEEMMRHYEHYGPWR